MSRRTLVFAIVSTAAITVVIAAVLVGVFERKQEARTPFFPVAEVSDTTEDPAVWGRNFPVQYESYLKTAEQAATKYGGQHPVQRVATAADPRTSVAQSKLEVDPRLAIMWAGYPFAIDCRARRGHAYMLEDQKYTRRVLEFKQPGTCLNCHASTYVLMNKLGNGDLFAGFDRLNHMPYAEAAKLAAHPVACIDCHDPKTMQLRVTRPAFLEGIRAYKAGLGVKDFDANRQATAQEMRSYVCGQCHAEYYFKPADKRLTFPWAKGLKVDDALAWYDEIGFSDWVHAETGAGVLKAQHPEFEMFSQGIHARAGVACADCHMPYRREGALKVSDHQVRSPLLNINRACQGCHHYPEQELKERVEVTQDRFTRSAGIALNALVELISDLREARKAGRSEAELAAAREAQRKAQFLIDYVVSENSTGFHDPGEALRILTVATDHVRRGQLALRKTAHSVRGSANE